MTMMLVPRKVRESVQEERSHFCNTLTRVSGQCTLGESEAPGWSELPLSLRSPASGMWKLTEGAG